jgi:hypothetical protein
LASSLRRKMLRDVTGRSGLRAFAALMVLYAGAEQRSGYSYRAGGDDGQSRVLSLNTWLHNSWRCAVANALIEHHLVPAVPAWQLPRFHRWLRAQGAYEAGAPLEAGYVDVLKRMTR